ncbi:MAG: hypothetical protein ACMUIE_05960 [Thermoplasmatota archaeon]
MSQTYNFSRVLLTDEPEEKVFTSVVDALRPLGGNMVPDRKKSRLYIENGKSGIMGEFMFKCEAHIKIRKGAENRFMVDGQITKDVDSLFWVFLIIGIFFWPLLFVLVFYFISDLGAEYQKRLERVDQELEFNYRKGGTGPARAAAPPVDGKALDECTHCGKHLDFAATPKYCPYCDGQLLKESKKEKKPVMERCPFCEKELNFDRTPRYCPYCDKQLTKE